MMQKKTFSSEKKRIFFTPLFILISKEKPKKNLLEKCFICTWKLISIRFDLIQFDVCACAWYHSICSIWKDLHARSEYACAISQMKAIAIVMKNKYGVHICESNQPICLHLYEYSDVFRHIEMHKCNTNWLTYSDPQWAKNLHATMYYMHGKKMNKISGFELEKEKQEKLSIGSASKTSKIDSKIKWIGQQSNHWNGIAIKVNCVYALYFSLSFFFLPLSLAG